MVAVIAAFGFIALAGLKIALNAPSVMARCVAGLTTMLTVQAIFNMGAAMVVLPLAGGDAPLREPREAQPLGMLRRRGHPL